MFAVQISQRDFEAYSSPVFSWACTLCSQSFGPNLDSKFVVDMVLTHMIYEHNTDQTVIKVSEPRKILHGEL